MTTCKANHRIKIYRLLLCFFLISLTVVTYGSNTKAASLNKKKLSLYVTETFQLKMNGTNKKATWSTTGKKIASVNSKGLVTARKAGKATIKAKINGKAYTCKVTVSAKPKISCTKKTLTTGDRFKLILKKSNGASVKATKYKSTSPGIATVTGKGVVTARNPGSCKIYTYLGTIKYTTSVIVNKKPDGSSDASVATNGNTSQNNDTELTGEELLDRAMKPVGSDKYGYLFDDSATPIKILAGDRNAISIRTNAPKELISVTLSNDNLLLGDVAETAYTGIPFYNKYIIIDFTAKKEGTCIITVTAESRTETYTISINGTNPGYARFEEWKKSAEQKIWTPEMTKYEKMEAAARYIVENVPYDYRISYWDFALGYGGDCMAGNNALTTFAEDLGIKARIYHQANFGYPKENTNHHITWFKLDGIEYLIDATPAQGTPIIWKVPDGYEGIENREAYGPTAQISFS